MKWKRVGSFGTYLNVRRKGRIQQNDPKSPRESGELKELMIHHVSYYHPSLHFTSLHFNFSSQEESGLYPFSSMNGYRDLSAQLRAHIHKISSTQVLFSPLPPLWFLSFKKNKETNKSGFFRWSPNCQIALFVCLVWRSSELLNLTLTFLRVSFTYFIIRRSRL